MKKLLLCPFLFFAMLANAQVSMISNGSYNQNFDGLASTGMTNTWTDNSTIANIFSQRTSTSAQYAANDGTSNAGGLYSYGTTSASDRALGTIGSANATTGGSFAHGVLLQNNSGLDISDIKVSYTLEQWRNGGNITANTITFWYKISSTAITSLTPASNTGWTAVTALNTNSPINTATGGALNGNLAANRVTLTDIAITGISVPNGAYLMLRWADPDHTGTDHGLAIDDITVTWTVPCNTPQTFYKDMDNDGFGDPNTTISACSAPLGYVTDNTDCNDNSAAINPNTIWYADADTDGFGDPNSLTQTGCLQPNGYINNNQDCNDNNANQTSLQTWFTDADSDGYGDSLTAQSTCSQPTGAVLIGGDCDDNNPSIHPGASDIPNNGIDEDCSGSDAVPTVAQLGIYEFTQASACPVTATSVTTQPSNATFSAFSSTGTNCSAAANVFSNAGWNTTQTIDLNEYNQFSISAANCNLLHLSKLAFNHRSSASGGTPTWVLRSSLDNYTTDVASGLSGNNNNVNLADTVALSAAFGSVSTVTFRFYIKGITGTTATWRMDNVSLYGFSFSLPILTYYADTDGDGYGNAAVDSASCILPTGFVLNNTDCNDSDSLVNPETSWYMDMDQDGFGDASMSTIACIQPTGYVLDGTDCNDNDNSITGSIMFYMDADNDGFGDFATGTLYCSNPGNGYVTNSTDCDDSNPSVHPGATEICDNIDNNCNNQTDEGLLFVSYFTDADGDGFGTGAAQNLCQNPGTGFATQGGDCNDNNPAINPNATEITGNTIDENCDGLDGILGIENNLLANVSIVPNPSNGQFVINGNFASSDVITMEDLNGKQVFKTTATSNSVSVNLAFPAGIYLVKVNSNQMVMVQRVVIR